MAAIFRGSTPTIKFTPSNGMRVSDLGTPTIAISQERAFIVYSDSEVTVDTTNNCVSVKLTEDDTLQLVPGTNAKAQCIFADENDNVIRFPVYEIPVMETLVESVLEVIGVTGVTGVS